MSLRKETPCDWGSCPYADPITGEVNCEYWCGEYEEPDEYYDNFEDEIEYWRENL